MEDLNPVWGLPEEFSEHRMGDFIAAVPISETPLAYHVLLVHPVNGVMECVCSILMGKKYLGPDNSEEIDLFLC